MEGISFFVNATEDTENRANPLLKARQTGFSQSRLTKGRTRGLPRVKSEDP